MACDDSEAIMMEAIRPYHEKSYNDNAAGANLVPKSMLELKAYGGRQSCYNSAAESASVVPVA
jgi:hypothetical protein